ncbi:hypothetical protein T492DRAFT_910115, partial [Pavlovales sp. CCMP2436]
MEELHFPRGYTRNILRACERGERKYCHTADTSGREPAHCVYHIGGVEVAVQELQVAQGGLGWRVWVGGLILAEWLAAHADSLRDASVLELGSGLGLPGLVASQLGARSVAMSDCLEPLVRNLELNVRLNASRVPASTRVRVCAVDVRAALGKAGQAVSSHRTMEETVDERHGFGENTDWLRPDEQFDVVIGSEILYEKYHARTMADAVAAHLRRPTPTADSATPDSTASRPPRAYIMYVNRDDRFLCTDGILWGFVRTAQKHGLAVRITACRQRTRGPLSVVFAPQDPPAETERVRASVASVTGDDDVHL